MSDAYEFEDDWVSPHENVWRGLLRHLIDAPVHVVEIGAWEGRSTIWWLDHIATHPLSRLTTIDPFGGPAEGNAPALRYRRFLRNLSLHPRAHQVTLLRTGSRVALQSFADATVDLVYVDGSHEAIDVLGDAVLAWHKVKPRGVIVFDDYQWKPRDGVAPPALAIDAFLAATGATVLHKGYQVAIRR